MARLLATERGMTVERPNTLAGMVEKRAEIAGQISHTRAVLRQLIIDLDHIDAAIRIFDPSSRCRGYPPEDPERRTPGDSGRHDAGDARYPAGRAGADDD
jgi:hypothetical protein